MKFGLWISLLGVCLAFAVGSRQLRANGWLSGTEAQMTDLSAPGCNTCCENACECADCCRPRWIVTADALFLNRSDPDAAVLAFNTADPTQNLNAADFDLGTQAGFDVSLTRSIGTNSAIELRYFGIDQWSDAATAATTPADLLQINAAVPIFTFSGTSIDGTYSSELHNAEANFRHQCTDWLDVLAGFRSAELDEQMTLTLPGAAVPFNYLAAARNRLYGAQVGGEVFLWNRNAFSLDVIGKAGIYSNRAAQDSVFTSGIVALPANGRGDLTAFIGEIGLTSRYQVNDYVAIRGGYRALWIDGVALGSQQLAVSDFANGTGFAGVGDVVYHGTFAGLELAW